MFNLRRILASFAAPRTPYDAALRDLAHGRPAQALARLDELQRAEHDPERKALIANKRGVALVAMDARERAREAFEAALAFAPEFAPALVNLGNLAFESDRLQEAIALYRRALHSDAGCAAAHRHLGLAYRRMGRETDALRELGRARRLEGPAVFGKRR